MSEGKLASPFLGKQPMRITSPYGDRINPVTHESQHHSGVDVRASEGTYVFAPGDGTIAHYYRDGMGDGNPNDGTAIAVDLLFEGRPIRVWYLHLRTGNGPVGRKVTIAHQIGATGNTGRSTGPHLHLQVEDPPGHPVDPIPYFPEGSFTVLP